MSTRISSLSIRTTVPSTTSPCLKLLMSESCSASSSSIVVGSGPRSRGAGPGRPRPRPRRRRRVGGVVGAQRRRRRHRRPRPAHRPSAAVAVARRPRPRLAGASASVAAAAARGASALGGGCVGAAVGVGRRRLGRVGASAAMPRRRRLGRGGLGAAVIGWSGRRPSPRWSPRHRLVAGSSATAIAAAARSGVWSASRRSPRLGAVPPCCSSVKCLVSPVGQVPRHDNGLGSAQAGSETIRGGPW